MPPDEPSDSFASLFEASPQTSRGAKRVAVGDQLDVVVVSIGKGSVFVELDGKQEGFIESAELLSDDDKLVVSVGSRLTARVAEIDGGTGATRLSPVRVRASAAMPTGGAVAGAAGAPVVSVGSRVTGIVAGIERYGVFLRIGAKTEDAQKRGDRGPRGLIPVAELGAARGADLRKLYAIGQELAAKVVGIDEQSRIRLSVRELASDDERAEFEQFSGGAAPAPAAGGGAKPKRDDKPRSLGTLGDLLAKANVKAKPSPAAPVAPAERGPRAPRAGIVTRKP